MASIRYKRHRGSVDMKKWDELSDKDKKVFNGSEKEYEKHLISSPSKKQHNKAFNMGNGIESLRG